MIVAVTDPVDARLLAAVAEVGKAAVHEVAAKVGMDPREVAYRLVNLSANGLPLLVGVESDPNGLRAVLADSAAWGQQPGPPPQQHPAPPGPHGQYPVQGAPSGAYPVHGAPSGAYPGAASGMASGPYRQPPPPQQVQQVQQTQQVQQLQQAPPRQPPPQQPSPQQPPQQPPSQPPPAPDPVMSTWGPPQSALWARGDQQPGGAVATAPPPATEHKGKTGDVLETQGLEGERLAIQLLEVQDPADFLFGAAGYELSAGERAVVVHTEITNRGGIPFASLPDNYLELITADGTPVAKAPVSLASRPPHKIGVQPAETTGGHTVYVLPEATRVTAVRWNARPEPDERTVTWLLDD